MNRTTQNQESGWVNNPHLSTAMLTPLEERCAVEKPQLLPGLQKLKAQIGAEKFSRYINPIQNMNQSDQTILIVAGNEMRRSHIVRECIPAIKAAFGADTIHVIGGGGFAGIGGIVPVSKDTAAES